MDYFEVLKYYYFCFSSHSFTVAKTSSSKSGIKTYMLSTCSHYPQTIVEKFRGEEWFCTEKEAKDAGFIKSVNCK